VDLFEAPRKAGHELWSADIDLTLIELDSTFEPVLHLVYPASLCHLNHNQRLASPRT
jgi:hypothetical protein